MLTEFYERAPQICEEIGVALETRQVGAFDPPAFDETCVKAIREAAQSLGYSYRDIVSCAGHDACWVNDVAPTGMIMCPCTDGLSHNEAEHITKRMGKGWGGRLAPRHRPDC